MKILMISSDYLPNPGGISGHVYELSRELAEMGHTVDLLVGHNEIHNALASSELPENANVLLNISFPWTYRGYIGYIRKVSKAIEKASAEKKYDLIHWHNLTWETLAIKKSKTTLPKIFTNHSSGFLRRMKVKWRKSFQMPWILKEADWILTPSEELLEKSIDAKFSREKITYIPNGVNLKQFVPGDSTIEIREEFGIPLDSQVIVIPRRLDPKNGVDILVNAMGEVIKTFPQIKVLFIGDGEQKEDLIEVAKLNGSLKHLIFAGSQPRVRMPLLLQLANLAVLPSRAEAVSLAGLEAMACELPVIGSNVGGIPQFVIPGQTGELFESENVNELAEKIIEFFKLPIDKQKSLGVNARDFVSRKFSWRSAAEQTVEAYKLGIDTKKVI
jgi:glycosyltransferase involved in cell wall biosynthesis